MRTIAGAIMEYKAVAIRGKDEGDFKGGSVVEPLLHTIADAVVVVLNFDESDGDIGFVVKNIIGSLAFTACDELASNDDPPLGEADFFAYLGHLIPSRLFHSWKYEFGADVAFR